ncbi:hypothetical protein OROGR_012532 [Orobanche gracilis]
MQTLQEKASEWSGVATNDAFAIESLREARPTDFHQSLHQFLQQFMMMRRSGSGRFSQILRRKKPFKISMSSSPKEWEGLHCSAKEEVGDEIYRELIQLKPNDAGCYVLLSNMYALAGNWDSARMIRVSLKSNNLKKNPGFSYVEINGEMFTFMATQKDHPHYLEIKKFLEGLMLKIKSAGYEPDTNSVVLNVSNDVKEDILFHHSEKLAVAFGLMRTKPGTVVRITKNLRICDDCHLASKFVSKVYDRVLIIKDANRFHVFRDGICSCNDWW